MRDELGTEFDMPGDGNGMRLDWRDMLRRDPCAYCGGPGGTIDHIVPVLRKSRGGGENATTTNGTGCCVKCNGAKKNISLLGFLLDLEGTDAANRKARREYHIREQLKRKIFTDEQLQRLKAMIGE